MSAGEFADALAALKAAFDDLDTDSVRSVYDQECIDTRILLAARDVIEADDCP